MKEQKKSLLNFLSYGFLSFFGTGFAPFAPGTFGSLATIPLIYALSYLQISFTLLIVFTSVLFIIACYIAHIIQIQTKNFDPGWIVIDEVIGMLVTWMFIFPSVSPEGLLAVFLSFRFFDIIKIWPASYFDKKMKNGFATIFDDVLAGLYAGIILLVLNYIHWIK